MPWPMVHFAIAEQLYVTDPTPHFLLGSIAPDAIHMREHATREHKGVTHLVCEGKLPSIEQLRNHCLNYWKLNHNNAWKDYILGYFAHLYADLRWTETVYADFDANYQGRNEDKRRLYTKEVSQVEFDYLKAEGWPHRVIKQLKQAEAFTIEPFVTESEVLQYRDVKIEWLRNDRNEPKISPKYFTKIRVDQFVKSTSDELNQLYKEWAVGSAEMVSGRFRE
ncbi:hypothetical protein [Paenibacillus nasutitermitis]|uniref:Phospholipase C/D domain-containing protein n=1 Tax=Paenibacillus nasutitermitis TaxID=1652958 RepID=A0A916Z5P2_9BACL|nr:hypothetical protein [Paenibacillus nasutitermitis]GGD77996.1 hypothetical protein GCM10010911_39980 [Paenibacillus nasutitermitis]